MADRVVPPSEILTANGVTLRRWRSKDAGRLATAVRESQTHLRPWMPWAKPGYDRADAAEFLARATREWDAGEAFQYAVLRGQKEIIGSAGLMARRGPGVLEIGYWVHVRHTGAGVATRAAAALTTAGLAVPGIDRIEILHDAANTASAGVPRRLGFRNLGKTDTPSEGGADVLWRLDAVDFPSSPVPDALGHRRY